jgi:DNA-binding NtrC family response regulator
MPGEIDGFGLAKWIRENRPHLAVFVASGYPGKVDLAQELCAGEKFFLKPRDLELVAAQIHEHLAARRGQNIKSRHWTSTAGAVKAKAYYQK